MTGIHKLFEPFIKHKILFYKCYYKTYKLSRIIIKFKLINVAHRILNQSLYSIIFPIPPSSNKTPTSRYNTDSLVRKFNVSVVWKDAQLLTFELQ